MMKAKNGIWSKCAQMLWFGWLGVRKWRWEIEMCVCMGMDRAWPKCILICPVIKHVWKCFVLRHFFLIPLARETFSHSLQAVLNEWGPIRKSVLLKFSQRPITCMLVLGKTKTRISADFGSVLNWWCDSHLDFLAPKSRLVILLEATWVCKCSLIGL